LYGWRRLFSLEHLILFIWILGFAVYVMSPFTDPDTPWHLATGRYILQHHQVPTVDPFSWTMHGRPWITHEWLFEVVLAWLAGRLQFVGAWLLYASLHALTVLVLYRLAVRVTGGGRVLSAVLACVGTLASLDFWTLRPQLVSYLMFAVFLWILQCARDGRTVVIWLIPPLLWLWANAHASASIGVLMVLLEVGLSFLPSIGRLQEQPLPGLVRLQLLLSAGVGFALGLVNPNHLRAYTYSLLSTNSDMTNNIMEWHSPDFHTSFFQQGVLPFLIVSFLILLARQVPLPLRETLFFGGSFAVTLIYQRFLPYLTIAAVPLLAYVLADWDEWFEEWVLDWRWLRTVTAILSALGMVAGAVWFARHTKEMQGPLDQHFSGGAYPVAAVDYLKQHHLTYRLLNAYQWGGYLIYRGVPTFVDGRTDVFLQSSVFDDYLALRNVWWQCQQLLDSYRFQAALFPDGDPIVTYLENQPNWRVVYQDGTAVVLVRHTKSTAHG
jgi:hypothetical protein